VSEGADRREWWLRVASRKLSRNRLETALPRFIVGPRENHLHAFGSILVDLKYRVQRISQSGRARVIRDSSLGARQAIKGCGNLKYLAAGFQKLAV
jgi:hypothetical protein